MWELVKLTQTEVDSGVELLREKSQTIEGKPALCHKDSERKKMPPERVIGFHSY